MPPDPPDKLSRPSKRHFGSRPRSMTPSDEVIEITSESEISSSRKHDRHEIDPQVEGSRKRQKLKRGSEPPMRKDTTMTPRPKRKKARNEINRHKASRTSNHQELKEKVKFLEHELKSARDAHDDTNRELQADLDWHIKEVKTLQACCNDHDIEWQEEHQIAEAERQKNETLRQNLKDIASDAKAFKLSCQNKDDELKAKEEVIAAKQKELEDSKQRSTSLEERLAQTDLALKGKDESIAAKQTELDESKHESAVLRESLAEKEFALKGKNNIIDATQKQLDDSKHRSASFQESLAEAELALKGKYEAITALQEELKDSKRQSESVEECLSEMRIELNGKDETITGLKEALGEKERALKAAKRDQSDCRKELALRDEKLSSTERELDKAKKDLEKAAEKEDALYLLNEENGHRNYLVVQREENAKDKLKSERAESKKQTLKLGQEKDELQKKYVKLQVELKAQENERNKAVDSLQSKLHASRPRYNYKESDDKIKEDFADLRSSIRQFIDKYTRPVLNVTDQELKTVWPNWSPELRNFLASPLLYNLVLEAHIWERLLARLFSAESEVWAGDLGRSLEEMLRMAADGTAQAGYKSDDYIDFQYLRSSSSSLIGRLNGADFLPKYFDADCAAIISTLPKLCGIQKIEGSMFADAMGIFKDAREFAIQLRKLKAEYTLRMHQPCTVKDRLKHGFKFVSETMVDRSPNRDGKIPGQTLSVDFIVHPGLYKRGNNSGANYEVKTCLIKMGVACNASELFLKSGSSTSSRSSSKPAQKVLRPGEMKQTKEGNIPSSTVNKAKKGSSISNPVQLESEEHYSQQSVDSSSIPGLTPGSSAPKARDAARMNSGTTTNMTTRSRAPPKTDSNEHDGKSSTKSTNNHPYAMGAATGRGGGSCAKKPRRSKGSDKDPDYHPGSNN